MPDFTDLDERIALKKKIKRLQGALKKYGQHLESCSPWNKELGTFACTCGLAEALSKASEESQQ